MSRIYRQLPPKGTRLGIAFSGGLDTRCAVAWLADRVRRQKEDGSLVNAGSVLSDDDMVVN